MSDNIIVYDLETQKTFAEVGGHNSQKDLLVSYLGLYSYSQNKYFGFFEKDLPNLEAIFIQERPTIVGFNSISFDNAVLQPYFRRIQLNELPQIDILAEIYSTLGFRMKLESVAQATLGEGKSGSGLDAIRYYREGNFDALAKYCMDDVRITRDIYEYGKNHGFILYTSGGEYHRMPVSWAAELTITTQIQQAFTQHQKIKITYIKIHELSQETVTTELDILDVAEKQIDGFCHTLHTKISVPIQRILKVDVTNQTYAYQGTLL